MTYRERLEAARERDAESFTRAAHAKGTFQEAFGVENEMPNDCEVDRAFYKAGAIPRDELIEKLAEALERYKFISAERTGSTTHFSVAAEALAELERFLAQGGDRG